MARAWVEMGGMSDWRVRRPAGRVGGEQDIIAEVNELTKSVGNRARLIDCISNPPTPHHPLISSSPPKT